MEVLASIVIPVYKRAEWLIKCLDALQKLEFAENFEVVVVDDGSPNKEEIAQAVETASAGRLELTFSRKENGGPASARNHGVKLASGEIVCFLDDDSIADSRWLQEMISTFRNNPSVSVVNGCTRSYDRLAQIPLLLEKAVYPPKNWATCNIAYRREVFEALGGFDETFPEPSWEDNDLGLRAKWAGYMHVCNARALVYHPHESSLDEYKDKCCLNGRGAAIFSRKYLFRRPLWGVGTPILMSRRLIYCLFPSVWQKKVNAPYLKFLWSYYSLQGFLSQIANK